MATRSSLPNRAVHAQVRIRAIQATRRAAARLCRRALTNSQSLRLHCAAGGRSDPRERPAKCHAELTWEREWRERERECECCRTQRAKELPCARSANARINKSGARNWMAGTRTKASCLFEIGHGTRSSPRTRAAHGSRKHRQCTHILQVKRGKRKIRKKHVNHVATSVFATRAFLALGPAARFTVLVGLGGGNAAPNRDCASVFSRLFSEIGIGSS